MHGVIEMNLHIGRGTTMTITERMKEGTITNTIGGSDSMIIMVLIEAEISGGKKDKIIDTDAGSGMCEAGNRI